MQYYSTIKGRGRESQVFLKGSCDWDMGNLGPLISILINFLTDRGGNRCSPGQDLTLSILQILLILKPSLFRGEI
jgi:hypothetical protein